MIVVLAKYCIILFGIFFIVVGLLMLLKPQTARAILRKAGSTNFINYAEITIRIIPAVALIIYSDHSLFPIFFTVFGWIMFCTSLILYIIPRKLHHQFSLKSADILKPLYFQFISPISIIIGYFFIKSVI